MKRDEPLVVEWSDEVFEDIVLFASAIGVPVGVLAGAVVEIGLAWIQGLQQACDEAGRRLLRIEEEGCGSREVEDAK